MMRLDQRMKGVRVAGLVVSAAIAGSLLLSACGADSATRVGGGTHLEALLGADPERGVQAIQRYGCGSCHTIPGVAGANATVGPPLTRWAERRYIAGAMTNEPENLVRWIRNPQAIEPGTAMPNMGITETEAQDIARYLYTLR